MKLTLGEKLKDMRTKRKMTSKQVCEEIKNKFGYSLSVGKYNEMESDVDKDFGYRAFIYLSKFYEVSTDYLLGLTENPSIDESIQNACNVTGLSESAIKKITQLKKFNLPAYCGGLKVTGDEIINSLVLDQWFKAFIERLAMYYMRTRVIAYMVFENKFMNFNIEALDYEKNLAKLALFEVGQAANLIAENFKSPHFDEAASIIEESKTKFEKEASNNAQHNPTSE